MNSLNKSPLIESMNSPTLRVYLEYTVDIFNLSTINPNDSVVLPG